MKKALPNFAVLVSFSLIGLSSCGVPNSSSSLTVHESDLEVVDEYTYLDSERGLIYSLLSDEPDAIYPDFNQDEDGNPFYAVSSTISLDEIDKTITDVDILPSIGGIKVSEINDYCFFWENLDRENQYPRFRYCSRRTRVF